MTVRVTLGLPSAICQLHAPSEPSMIMHQHAEVFDSESSALFIDLACAFLAQGATASAMHEQ